MTRVDDERLRLSLVENAYDSLVESLDNARRAELDQRRWKFALLNVVHAVELLLKRCLMDQHPLLIWQDVDRPGRLTVGLEKALPRLVAAGVPLDRRAVQAIETAVRWRNAITHYETDLVIADVRANYLLIFDSLISSMPSSSASRSPTNSPQRCRRSRPAWQSRSRRNS